ncbi:Energy-coupling factor transporter ATP-binding protein EcfA2 [Paenibacillus konkukensis]|uniref:Energy-coupling factor transporter ATP-binding protein EcfA2 n=1 Tax=Paenibacillus konkukensis TaxID=2020716 RepID=A0ABY4RJH0_9BACL|nr:ATP-binding cassette domain-containing protein [Paenibacillus konkukensis]UQZ82617.1 Energy-coupling factor transporter ATP-binding protein EcfA2 [Paenibacillus konkukensis]
MTLQLQQVTVMPPRGGSSAILSEVSHTFPDGTVTLIAGRTGSGKSTLLHALAGLIPAASGQILCGGEPLWRDGRVQKSVWLRSGIVFQYPERQLFADSVMKEFLYSLQPLRLSKPEALARIRGSLALLELPESILQESVFTLSDGWKRKAALATAWAVQPDWLLLDEPTAGIDPQGIPPLLAAIKSHRERGTGGVIVVSHDLDTFLPVADQVLIMQRGTVAAATSPAELYDDPGPLLRAEVGLPASIRIAQELRKRGFRLAGRPLSADDTAEAVVRALRAPQPAQPSAVDTAAAEGGSLAAEPGLPPADAGAGAEEALAAVQCAASGGEAFVAAEAAAASVPAAAADEGLHRFHPIAKWIFYVAVSTGMLLQNRWPGLLFSALIVAAMVYAAGVSMRTAGRAVKAFAVFIVISALLSGVELAADGEWWRWQAASFSRDAAFRTVRQLSVFFLVLVAGVAFAVSTRPSMMQRGLEQALSFLERFRIPVSVFTFSASLLLRFIPLIAAETERMSLIVRARGKAVAKPGAALRLRDVPVFMIPLLLSMMRHAEDLALALEARGCKLHRLNRSSADYPPFRRRDWLAAAAGIALLILLFILNTSLKGW